ncbi:hypothetical protein [Candidatus Chloroploca sp. Khr17]|uniref:hypothetical protein n=1 Tax=Candidatus Chloroploca sp. Khr17 TaxID=2496869 RepID=UPI00101D5B49|nr:hypothetical protein [Candidatus Chloroploca sp. Khr17]
MQHTVRVGAIVKSFLASTSDYDDMSDNVLLFIPTSLRAGSDARGGRATGVQRSPPAHSATDKLGTSTPLDASPAGVKLDAKQRLTLAPDASAALNTALQEAGQFSLVVAFTPRNESQWGWLLTINGDESDHPNLALTQDRQHLLIRLRTVATNEHAMPALVLPELLATDQPRTIGLSYQRGILHAAVDGQVLPNRLAINPALAFFSVMLPFKANNVLDRYEWMPLLYTLLYSGLIFGSVGLALALWTQPTWTLVMRLAAALGGAVLAAILYAALITLAGGVWPSVGLMALQIGVALIAWAIFWWIIAPVVRAG